jgi:putative pyoverdin transport system ATP-binding/permease protein
MFRDLAVLLSYSNRVQNSRATILLSVLTGAVSGIGSTALVAVINVALTSPSRAHIPLGAMFAVLCLAIPTSAYCSEILLARLTAQAACDLRNQLSRRILSAPYRLLEEIGAPRLLATITEDTRTLTEAIAILPLVITQMAIVAGCLAYLGWLSWKLLLLVLGYMLAGTFLYSLPLRKAMKYFRLVREEWDHTFKAFRGITEGIKELKLNHHRRQTFLDGQVTPPLGRIRQYDISANSLGAMSRRGGQVLFYVLIGVVLFVGMQFLQTEPRVLTGYTLTVLFMIGPFTILLSAVPVFGRAHVATGKIKSLGLSLDRQPPEPLLTQIVAGSASWKQIELLGVTHVYRHEGAVEEFRLGPLSLAFNAGEVVFLIGGNGSGKTTLAKILMGLYGPEQGEVRLDGRTITLESRDEYRQRFAAVFYDFYLFEQLPGQTGREMESKGQEYLNRLQLDLKVKIVNGELSTLELSQGQRKRLALLTAFLEDRPIYVFDEWAADQDPLFKEVFYLQILPELKARGKTVIVITHDDHFYYLADRLIKLEHGQIEFDKTESGCLQPAQ